MIETYSAVWFLVSHQIDGEGSSTDEEDFHAGVVERNEVHEEVQVSYAKDE